MAQDMQMRRRSGYAALPSGEGQSTTDSSTAVPRQCCVCCLPGPVCLATSAWSATADFQVAMQAAAVSTMQRLLGCSTPYTQRWEGG
jgi:hypothetical protein